MSDRSSIQPTSNGPYRVTGVDSITRVRDGEVIEMTSPAALCRCGGSSTKPFCDGTHLSNGFVDTKQPDRVPDRGDVYVSGDRRISISDNRGLCAHSGVCTDNLADVFRLGTEPWIDPDGATAEAIAAVVDRCPSGALGYTIDGVPQNDRGGDTSIGFVPGGPYVVTGGPDLVDVDMPAGATADHCTLCRCGASTNKPFCSGAHWDVQFDDDAASPTDVS